MDGEKIELPPPPVFPEIKIPEISWGEPPGLSCYIFIEGPTRSEDGNFWLWSDDREKYYKKYCEVYGFPDCVWEKSLNEWNTRKERRSYGKGPRQEEGSKEA